MSTPKPPAGLVGRLGGRLHHLGFACRSLTVERDFFESRGFKTEGAIFEDSQQGVRGQFLVWNGVRIELLENLSDRQILTPWLRWSSRQFYHLGIAITQLPPAQNYLAQLGARQLGGWQAAPAFGGQTIVFFALRNGLLIELIK